MRQFRGCVPHPIHPNLSTPFIKAMNTRTSLCGLAALFAGAGLLLGQPKISPLDIDKDGRVTRDENRESFLRSFKSLDKDGDGVLVVQEFGSKADMDPMDLNHDGSVTQAEYLKKRDLQFDRLDQNRDGVWSPEEIANRKYTPPTADDVFATYDMDSNGEISKDEYRAFYAVDFKVNDKNADGALDSGEFPFAAPFKNMDADRDGKVTQEEYLVLRTVQFSKLDGNADGVLSKTEMNP